MNTFFGIFAYVLIGCFLAVAVQEAHLDECGVDAPDSTVAYTTFAWPMVFVAWSAETDGVLCNE